MIGSFVLRDTPSIRQTVTREEHGSMNVARANIPQKLIKVEIRF